MDLGTLLALAAVTHVTAHDNIGGSLPKPPRMAWQDVHRIPAAAEPEPVPCCRTPSAFIGTAINPTGESIRAVPHLKLKISPQNMDIYRALEKRTKNAVDAKEPSLPQQNTRPLCDHFGEFVIESGYDSESDSTTS
jgi:hypothetical protein